MIAANRLRGPSAARAGAHHPLREEAALPVEGIRLWLVDLDEPAPEEARPWLSASEQERSTRFVFARDARRYRVAHVALRRLLFLYGGVPAGVEFEIGAHGKPRLAGGEGCGFNLSHSGAVALIGIGPGEGIGVDLEVLHDIDDVWPLAEQNFTMGEYEALRRTPNVDVARAFLRGWTRKEACLKAVGSGLSIAPASFEAGLCAQSRIAALTTERGPVDVRVQSVELGDGMLSAVARTVHPPPPSSCRR